MPVPVPRQGSRWSQATTVNIKTLHAPRPSPCASASTPHHVRSSTRLPWAGKAPWWEMLKGVWCTRDAPLNLADNVLESTSAGSSRRFLSRERGGVSSAAWRSSVLRAVLPDGCVALAGSPTMPWCLTAFGGWELQSSDRRDSSPLRLAGVVIGARLDVHRRVRCIALLNECHSDI